MSGTQIPELGQSLAREEENPSVQLQASHAVVSLSIQHSWQDLVNKVNAQMDEDQVPHYLQSLHLGARSEKAILNSNQVLTSEQRGGALPPQTGWEARKGGMDDELQMGMVFRWQ